MDNADTFQEKYRKSAPKIAAALNRRNYEVFLCETTPEAVNQVLALIPCGLTISWGGSMTLDQIGIKERLKKEHYHTIDRDKAETEEERFSIMRESLLCDIYLSSVNAISEDGVMINIDATGNHISAIAFGPRKVILIIGINKVCRTTDEAKKRARTYAAPRNGIHQSLNLPYTKTGKCCDCYTTESMCSQIVEMHRNRIPGRITVVLVGESLGL